jgi:hypothetical protein
VAYMKSGNLKEAEEYIAVEYKAGEFVSTGSNNIEIGNEGSASGSDNGVIRIGTQGTQTSAFISG